MYKRLANIDTVVAAQLAAAAVSLMAVAGHENKLATSVAAPIATLLPPESLSFVCILDELEKLSDSVSHDEGATHTAIILTAS